ncbi:hypothetical protein SteCoe_33504 [Stentor coeruleus]|uniref:Uncharacterized protein n=1 Tax=Stentor coeruleus TaxID=5963 RepID=A0A1R2AWJ1_9CILI|nr:hypothetical protein SteCoe_33504 [Stentor coeruleus]
MDINCSFPMCLNKAYWQCNCPGCPKTCDLHVQTHRIKEKCLMKNIKSLYLAVKARSNQNALDTLKFDSINLAQNIIKEVKSCLIGNLNIISNEKQRIQMLTLSNNESQVRAILNWVASINGIKRNPKAFISSLNMLLGIDKNSIELLKEKEKQNILNKKIKEDLQISNYKIKKMEMEMAKLIIENENEKAKRNIDLAIYFAMTEKKFGKLNSNLEIAVKKLEEFKIIFPSSKFKKNFTCMTLEKKKDFLVNYDFENFNKDFKVEENELVDIILTKDLKYIFVCKAQSRLEKSLYAIFRYI